MNWIIVLPIICFCIALVCLISMIKSLVEDEAGQALFNAATFILNLIIGIYLLARNGFIKI